MVPRGLGLLGRGSFSMARTVAPLLRTPMMALRPPAASSAMRALPRLLSSAAPSSANAAREAALVQPSAAGAGAAAVRDATDGDGVFFFLESPTFQRFTNMMMMRGKKQTARKLVWKTILRIRDAGHDPQDVFFTALDNVRPMIELKSSRAGPTPFPIAPRRAEGQAMKWIISAARKKGGRGGKAFDRKLSEELIAACQLKGAAVQKRESVHRDAVTHQATAHFRWRAGSGAPAGSIDMDRKSYKPYGRRAIRRLQGAM